MHRADLQRRLATSLDAFLEERLAEERRHTAFWRRFAFVAIGFNLGHALAQLVLL